MNDQSKQFICFVSMPLRVSHAATILLCQLVVSSTLMNLPSNDNCVYLNHSSHTPAPHKLNKFQWIHFPKAGTSMMFLLHGYACNLPPEAFTLSLTAQRGSLVHLFERIYPFDKHCDAAQWVGPRVSHMPLKPSDAKLAVMMVRDPRRRLTSAYHNGPHAFGKTNEERQELQQKVKTIQDYVTFPGIAGCQVKMLTNGLCARTEHVDLARFKAALSALRNAAFVGITDHWDESVCLFHAMFGGESHPQFFKQLRATSEHEQDYHSQMEVDETADPWDWLLYREAMVLFRERQHRYGVPVRKRQDSTVGSGM
eukprot:TRINITY_DN8184_c0_g1_i3.p2 TRINITY_DN8184_c0_g1~~TRINITY_DN8184_c0_g1_i3.p2  ORF type:complete len:311 (+),score=52.19 TRINITY_DN8184_c0_g1_i3:1744-2676(+)